jgi:large subunit ribosomal protein L10
MARPEKVAQVEAIAATLSAAQSIVLADFSGMTVEQMTLFRSKCREQNVECRVVKNRLAKIAADRAEVEVLKDHLTGPTALVSAAESQVAPAKIVTEFAKEAEALTVKGGVMDGVFMDVDQVNALAKVPSFDELIAKMMGSINSPAGGICVTVNGVMGALVRAVDAVAKQKAA